MTKLGISLDAYRKTTTAEEGIRRLAEIGFDAIDLNLSDYCQPDSPLASEAWREWIEGIGAAAAYAEIPFCQVHAPIYHGYPDDANDVLLDLLTQRSLEACGMLSVPWAVFHPRTAWDGYSEATAAEIHEYNVDWIGGWADVAAANGTSIAIENLFNFDHGAFSTFGTRPETLCHLIDTIGRPDVAACLDTGHSFVSGFEPAEFARALGDRLRVLHVHDNLGREDQHVAPFAGGIDWAALMSALGEIAYPGVFSLEVHCQVQNMPGPIIDRAVSLVHDIGRHLVGAPTS